MIIKQCLVYVLFLLAKNALSMEPELQTTMETKKSNNVCRKLTYYFAGAKNKNECWYNPDVDSYAHDIIRRYGYSFESYKVTSNDNYITTLFRIPHGKKEESSEDRPPVLLLHGIGSSSHVMVDIGKQALAFVLADAGYDVWLGNLRGSSFSLGHTNMTYKNSDYWHFSFHEMGKYDLPTTLEFIYRLTEGKKIIFIGHSLAASAFHVFEALHRKLAKKLLKVAVLLSPLVYLSDIQPINEEFEKFGNPLMVLSTLLGVKSNSEISGEILTAKEQLCKSLPSMFQACDNGLYLAFGLNSLNIPAHYIPLMLAHNPSGFSINTLNHLLQISRNDGNFQMFDYGVEKNKEIYEDVFPPEYDIQGCEIPVIIFYGENDWISTEKDIERLINSLPSNIVKHKYKIKSTMWKHMDYFYGKYLPKLFYKPLLDSLEAFKDTSETLGSKIPSLENATTTTTEEPIVSTILASHRGSTRSKTTVKAITLKRATKTTRWRREPLMARKIQSKKRKAGIRRRKGRI